MNKTEQIHNERKEYWRDLIQQCDSSGLKQQEWCQENGICNTSMSKWRRVIWREEEAEKEIAAAREEHCFVEIKADPDEKDNEEKALAPGKRAKKCVSKKQTKQNQQEANEPRVMKPDAIIGYREYMIGVYEDTSDKLLRKVVEVLRYA